MGGPWSAESASPKNKAFIAAYKQKFGAEPDQFAAQAYDAMYIVAEALKAVKLSGNVEKDRQALRDALPAVKIEGATGPFAFRRAPPKPGTETGYDAQQDAHVFIAKGGKFVLMK
jgi:branched-chain amino acid transport system substrate-binding protein